MSDASVLLNHFQEARVTDMLIFRRCYFDIHPVCHRGKASGAVGVNGPVIVAFANELYGFIVAH
jgi:hypothetical protein